MSRSDRVLGNLWIRRIHLLKKGDVHEGHAHTHPHTTLLVEGSVRVKTQQAIEPPKFRIYTADDLILVPKGLVHEMEALTDNVRLFCLHPVRNGEGQDDIAPDDISPEDAGRLLNQFRLADGP